LNYLKKMRDYCYHLHLKSYLKSHPTQLKKIETFNNISKSILVISNTALGDTILSSSAIKSLKSSFKDTKIIFLVHKKLIPLFKDFSYIDNIIPFYGGYKRYFKTIKEIKKYKPKMAIILHGNGPQDIQIAVLSGCSFILKHPTKSNLKSNLSFDFTQKKQHTIEDRLDILRKINAKELYTKLEISKLNNKKTKDKINNYIKGKKIIIGFQIGAADTYKMWPLENFIELSQKLIKWKKDLTIIITGIQKEYNLAEKITKPFQKNILNSCGLFSIEELPYLIEKMNVLVTNDTGTLHLAIAIDTPTISLFSTTNSSMSGPHPSLINKHTVIQKDGLEVQSQPKKKRNNELMKLISAQEVFLELKKKLTHV